ncbi:MAG: hypothetical protein QW597_04150 [Thermoplasmataceae archaeon]
MKRKGLTRSFVLIVAFIVLVAGTLYYINSGKQTAELQGPYISVSAFDLGPSVPSRINNFSVYIYGTTSNATNVSNDQLLFSDYSSSSSMTGYLNRSFYSISSEWGKIVPGKNISLSLYAFHNIYANGNVTVYSFYNNLPYDPSSPVSVSFTTKVIFNTSQPALRIPVTGISTAAVFLEKMQLTNTSTLQNSSIVLGAYLNSTYTQASAYNSFSPSSKVRSSVGYLQFRGISYLSTSNYLQESINPSFSNASLDFKSIKPGVSMNSELVAGPVELHVSNFMVETGYTIGSAYYSVSNNTDTTIKVLASSNSLSASVRSFNGSTFLSLFNEFISSRSQSTVKTGANAGNLTIINDQNWTHINPQVQSDLSTLSQRNTTNTLLVLSLGLSVISSDYKLYGSNSSQSLPEIISNQMGINLPHLSDFNTLDIAQTECPFSETNDIISSGPGNLTASFYFSNLNVSVSVFSGTYSGPLPITATIVG